jgi:hypothetical protein
VTRAWNWCAGILNSPDRLSVIESNQQTTAE